MSHMRDLESRLRKDTTDIEIQIPFWEFLDIEFDAQKKHFYGQGSEILDRPGGGSGAPLA